MGSSPNFKFSPCINLVLIFSSFFPIIYIRYGQVKSRALEENQGKKEIQTKYQGWFVLYAGIIFYLA